MDQIWVDSLPGERFHPEYDDGMWRRWRCSHLAYISDRLLPTVHAIPLAMLEDLTRVAITYEPAVVGERALDLFADAAAGSCPEEELGTAAAFFGWLIEEVRGKPEGKLINFDARAQITKWLPVTDPLRIAEDPECSYGEPVGFVR